MTHEDTFEVMELIKELKERLAINDGYDDDEAAALRETIKTKLDALEPAASRLLGRRVPEPKGMIKKC